MNLEIKHYPRPKKSHRIPPKNKWTKNEVYTSDFEEFYYQSQRLQRVWTDILKMHARLQHFVTATSHKVGIVNAS